MYKKRHAVMINHSTVTTVYASCTKVAVDFHALIASTSCDYPEHHDGRTHAIALSLRSLSEEERPREERNEREDIEG